MAVRIGVLQTLGLGDFLTALPAMRAIRRNFPDAQLTFVGKPEYLNLVEPIFDDVVELRDLGQPQEVPEFDLGFNFHGRGPTSHQRLHRSRHLIAFYDAKFSPDGPQWNGTCHIRTLWTGLIGHFGLSSTPDDFLLSMNSAPDDTVVIHVDARDRDRWWPLERFARVIEEVGHPVAIIGQRLGHPRGLLESQELVKKCALVVSVDSGIAHLAYAHQRASITLFGPAPARRWGPPTKNLHRVLGNESLFEKVSPQGPCSPHLLAVTDDDVLAAAKDLLNT